MSGARYENQIPIIRQYAEINRIRFEDIGDTYSPVSGFPGGKIGSVVIEYSSRADVKYAKFAAYNGIIHVAYLVNGDLLPIGRRLDPDDFLFRIQRNKSIVLKYIGSEYDIN